MGSGRSLFRQGDGDAGAAAEDLFRKYFWYGVGYARRLGAESHTAEDLGSEAFIRLWRRLEGAAPVRSVPAYLRMVVHNLYVDHVRKAAPVLVGTSLELDRSTDADLAEVIGSGDVVMAILAPLSLRHRRILELTVIMGLGTAEAAKVMGISPGAAAVLAHRARAAARLSPVFDEITESGPRRASG